MYGSFAYVYDKLMKDVDYGKWSDYIEGIFTLHGIKPKLILDLACGTGSTCVEMALRGYDMIGIDNSIDMLNCARNKAESTRVEVLYLNQDITDFELYGTVDVIICLMDSLNYIVDSRKVVKMFELVNNYLNPEGLFIFDINSCYKFEHILAGNVFYSVENEITYIWDNSYDHNSKICRFDLTFFERHEDVYRRYDELHLERAYSTEEMVKMLEQSGLNIKKIYGDLTYSSPETESERIFFVCGK